MASLKIGDLKNTFNGRNNPDVAGQIRATRFISKAEKGDEFEVEGESKPWYINRVDDKSKYFLDQVAKILQNEEPDLYKKQVLIVDDSKYIWTSFEDIPTHSKKYVTLSAFTKTSEFGSSKQTTEGSTEDVEDLTAFFCAMRAVSNADLSPGYLNSSLHELASKAKCFVSKYTKEDLEKRTKDLLDKEGMDKKPNNWLYTYIATANVLASRGYLEQGMSVHRDSNSVKKLYSMFGSVKGHERYSNRNKWTPADIWLVSPGFILPSGMDTLEELNSILLAALEDRELVGVSLKALSLGKEPRVEEYNVDQQVNSSHRISKKDIKPDADAWLLTGKTGNTLKVGQYKITFRCTTVHETFATGFVAEVIKEGEVARVGKAGLPAINFELGRLGLGKLPLMRDLVTNKQQGPHTGAEFSKTEANMLHEMYETLSDDQKVQFVNGILEYAMSETSDAAPFVKVY